MWILGLYLSHILWLHARKIDRRVKITVCRVIASCAINNLFINFTSALRNGHVIQLSITLVAGIFTEKSRSCSLVPSADVSLHVRVSYSHDSKYGDPPTEVSAPSSDTQAVSPRHSSTAVNLPRSSAVVDSFVLFANDRS